jgi:hypothetical protein
MVHLRYTPLSSRAETQKVITPGELFASTSFLTVRKASAKVKTGSIEFKGCGQKAKMNWMTFQLSDRT